MISLDKLTEVDETVEILPEIDELMKKHNIEMLESLLLDAKSHSGAMEFDLLNRENTEKNIEMLSKVLYIVLDHVLSTDTVDEDIICNSLSITNQILLKTCMAIIKLATNRVQNGEAYSEMFEKHKDIDSGDLKDILELLGAITGGLDEYDIEFDDDDEYELL